MRALRENDMTYTERHERHIQGDHRWEAHEATLTPNSNQMTQKIVARSDRTYTRMPTGIHNTPPITGSYHHHTANKSSTNKQSRRHQSKAKRNSSKYGYGY